MNASKVKVPCILFVFIIFIQKQTHFSLHKIEYILIYPHFTQKELFTIALQLKGQSKQIPIHSDE